MASSGASSQKKRKIPGVIYLEPALYVSVWENGSSASKAKKRTEKWLYSQSSESETSSTSCTPETESFSKTGSTQNTLDFTMATTSEVTDTYDAANINSSGTKKETDHAKYRRKRNIKWEQLRPLMVQALLEEMAPPLDLLCLVCKEEIQGSFIRCTNCGPMSAFCHDCCINVHRYMVLHQPEEWKDGQFIPFLLPMIDWKRLGHHCATDYSRTMYVLDQSGEPHCEVIHFCHCEDESVTLVRLGLWPATPLIPKVAISIGLLMNFRSLFCAGKVSLSAFAASLRNRYSSQYSTNSSIFNVFNWDMVISFCIVHHKILSQEALCYGLKPTEVCPVCPKIGKVIAMDGNFSLVQRKRGNFDVPERNADRFFFDQRDVDQHVSSYAETRPSGQCSNFQVESALRSKATSEKLVVKGIFGSVCRHDYPYKFLDMKHGERLAYPVYLLRQAKDETKLILYDIACSLKTHLEKRGTLPIGTEFSVPIFHVYGHNLPCQIKYSPRRITGAGLCDGEGTERLWSFLGDFGSITKEMTPSNRRDAITELLLHYATKIMNQMVRTLSQKIVRACLQVKSTNEELENMLTLLPDTVSKDDVRAWSQAEREREIQPTQKIVGEDDWKKEYALNLQKYYFHREQMVFNNPEEQDEDEERDGEVGPETENHEREAVKSNILLRRTERNQKIVRWKESSREYKRYLRLACEGERKECLEDVRNKVVHYHFLTHTKRRKESTGGQAIAKRVARQLLASSKKVDTAVSTYNKVPCYGRGQFVLTRTTAMDLNSHPYLEQLDPLQLQSDVPLECKRKAIDTYNLHERSTEETYLLVKDMRQFKESAVQRKDMLTDALDTILVDDTGSRLEVGCAAGLRKGIADVHRVIQDIDKKFGPFLTKYNGDIDKVIGHFKKLDEEMRKQNDAGTDEIVEEENY